MLIMVADRHGGQGATENRHSEQSNWLLGCLPRPEGADILPTLV